MAIPAYYESHYLMLAPVMQMVLALNIWVLPKRWAL